MTALAALHADISVDGRTLVLMGSGHQQFMIEMAAQLATATPLFTASDPPGALTTPATWWGLVQIANVAGAYWAPSPRLAAWVAGQLRARAAAGTGELRAPVPAGLTPRAYQVAGALMIAELGRALLFDDAGTGKTVTTVLGLAERAHRGLPVFPVVVVAPAGVVDPWVEAWQTWAPGRRVTAWRGAGRLRRAGLMDVYVTSYDTARNDAAGARSALVKLGARSVVLDECHLIKSPQAARSRAARRLARKADGMVALSGTPITHNPRDVWPTLEALEPGAVPSSERYVDRYCESVRGDYRDRIIGLNPFTEPELRTGLMGQFRRVSKADVLPELPDKVYSVRTVQLPSEWRRAYDEMEAAMIAQLPNGQELSVMDKINQLSRLAQLACAAADVEVTTAPDPRTGEPVEHTHVELRAPSWKVDELMAVLAERPGQPVVAFAGGMGSRQLALLAGAQAEAAGLSVGYVVGGQAAGERTRNRELFQAGKLDLLCATTGAGGVGLTFTAAGTAVFLSRPFSLVEASQAEDRCHRIGSEHHSCIEIIDIVAANTVDARVRSVLRQKAKQLAELLQDPRIFTELLGGTSHKGG